MVLLVTTTYIISAFEAVPPSSRKELDLPDSLSIGSPISHEQVIRLSRYSNNGANSTSPHPKPDRSLNSLLRGTRVYVPPPSKKPEPSPEYLALKARLLAAAETDAYNRMTASTFTSSAPGQSGPSPIFSSSTPTLSALHDSKALAGDTGTKDPLTPSLVLNIFLSVLITGFSVYWALTSFRTPDILVSSVSSLWRGQPPSKPSANRVSGGATEPVRVLVSLLAALMVGVAEVLIYAIYLQKVDQARAREGRIKERKEVVETDVVRAGPGQAGKEGVQRIDGEQETIWGRGANGGVRRRVREKWEEKESQWNHDG
ncbi:hypothetical protein KXW98_002191 [Aspergillus fumigatus]|nr:hypothetical protein CNMCM8686_003382 [Aspergillus fumigatus]KAH1276082.1 hypothetical protein KXX45_005649 [Aspergillus fumigatus]KAH1290555.1 hypothetical protein KXX48_007877 [Aspergillus fumigatus]KAH1293747.1 hypothetical protein KXX30_003733 [Aspergillus fumigatus]KAH1314972.1 hypothetical protein KXX66_006840 [Aspergillus fumigatus]